MEPLFPFRHAHAHKHAHSVSLDAKHMIPLDKSNRVIPWHTNWYIISKVRCKKEILVVISIVYLT